MSKSVVRRGHVLRHTALFGVGPTLVGITLTGTWEAQAMWRSWCAANGVGTLHLLPLFTRTSVSMLRHSPTQMIHADRGRVHAATMRAADNVVLAMGMGRTMDMPVRFVTHHFEDWCSSFARPSMTPKRFATRTKGFNYPHCPRSIKSRLEKTTWPRSVTNS